MRPAQRFKPAFPARLEIDLYSTIQSALHPESPDAHAIATLAWVLFAGGAAIFAIVLALAAYAFLAPPERRKWLASDRFVLGAGIVFPVAALAALLVYSLAMRSAMVTDKEPPAVRIEVIGEQWWWRVHYLDARGAIDFITANEIRIPAGAPVEIALKSQDVIHSFWVPNLSGKLDMIPGRVNRLRLRAERPGVSRGQCAEYCGGPHAKMALYVIAETPETFDAWRERQRAPAALPDHLELRRGLALFLAHCAACHAIRGTPATASRAPDLTHVGSRISLAAGMLPMNRGTLAAWISASQTIKPGNLMPSMPLFTGEELRALAGYLASLE